MSTGKRLYQYAVNFKGIIIVALVMLTIGVAADLAGPFVAKRIIDSHILGIESKWYETTAGENAVPYEGTWYKREAYFTEEEEKGEQVVLLQQGLKFVFSKEDIPLEGQRTLEGTILTVDGKSYDVQFLESQEIMKFYEPEISKIIQLIALYFGLLVVASFFSYGQRYYLQKAANRVIQKMRNDVFKQISRLPISYFDNLPAGKVVARITNDTEAIKELYVTVLANFFSSIIYLIGIYIALSILNVKLALLCLILVPILIVWTILYRKYASTYNKVIRARVSDINGMINESIQGMPIIQAFGREKETANSFKVLNDEHFQFQNKMLRLNSLTSHNLVGILRNFTFVAFIWYFGNLTLNVETVVSLGMLYAIVDYINRLFHPVQNIVNQFANLEQALVAGERVFELLDEQGTDVSEEHIPRYEGNVEFQNVSFGYKEGEYVLKNLTFSAKHGETIALVGHTGSGKSSIMNLLFRFYDTNEGRILVDGTDLKSIPRQTLREHMGIVLQDPYLFTGTIATNVSLNNPKISREVIEKALKDVGADTVLSHLEKGIDSEVIEKGSTLSSGQRQLISFARALAFNPAILILDEATSSIDTETEAIIQEAMDVLKKGRTTFIIAHRLSTIKNADQILVLDKGRIVERGTHDELMAVKGKYYNMYELQLGVGKGIA
ncbi:ABC transporter ATP-binding protein [Peribacillus acanthi]|uniref:ABC transporter ATP-binding protein n=1 Tax=Peribacillus acanthi TaxID=2171554 RepID=UPI000D3E4BED|nr:ABC transporter ATP-binding protein [Peribacillus acanthi]